ncbi:MAG: phosphatidylserine decarboxylase family protein [Thermodesulfobacteriota bacterium]
MRGWKTLVAKEGYPFIFGSFVFVLLFWALQVYTLTILSLFLTIFIVYFFRDPERTLPPEENAIVSPADGKVIIAEKVYEEGHLKKEVLKISIFMTVFNVHVNRVPLDGEVIDIDYHPGKFLNASFDKASSENERNELLIRDKKGREILLVQIAGLIARRIVCYLSEGSKVVKGERFGLIRFGSRLDIYLPLEVELCVKVGQKVKAGETMLCSLK